MIELKDIHRGVVCKHHKGNVYTIIGLLNNAVEPTKEFPTLVHYIGANGNQWARPIEQFTEKFTVMFDGNQKV